MAMTNACDARSSCIRVCPGERWMYDQYLFVLITGIFLVKAEEVIGVRLAVPAPQFWQQLLVATHNQILRQITF